MAAVLLSIGIAWMVEPKPNAESAARRRSNNLQLVIGAMILDKARHGSERR